MPRISASVSVPPMSAYAGDLTPELQRTLATLADVEMRLAVGRERLAGLTGPEGWRDRVRAALEAQYRREREPLVQRLGDLQREMTMRMMWSRRSLH